MPNHNHNHSSNNYQRNNTMVSTRHRGQNPHAADESLMELMGQRNRGNNGGPMSPRHDQPQVNIDRHHQQQQRHQQRHQQQQQQQQQQHHKSATKRSSSKKKSSKKHSRLVVDDLDEASKEAHIVQKIEMAIKKSRSERRAGSRSRASSRSSSTQDQQDHRDSHHRHHHHHHHTKEKSATDETPSHRGLFSSEGSEYDENYQMNKPMGDNHNDRIDDDNRGRQDRLHNNRHHEQRSKPKRTYSSKQKIHKPKAALEAPKPSQLESSNKQTMKSRSNNKYKQSGGGGGLVDVDEQHMDRQMDGLVGDKRGFQVQVDNHQWIRTNFSDPTLDTYENRHFLGQQKMKILDPQRIQCGPARSESKTDCSSSGSGIGLDPVTSIIDRIYEKKEQTGHTYTRKAANQQSLKADAAGLSNPIATAEEAKRVASAKAQLTPTELISFDNYEDDDGYYYEDDEDDYPMYPSSKSPPPAPASTVAGEAKQQIPITMNNFPGLVNANNTFGAGGAAGVGAAGDVSNMLQTQLEEINQLHRDIQCQQDMIKQVTQMSAKDAASYQGMSNSNPNETSAEVYHRELARQGQAELQRLELVQKSMMLEKQMEIYRRSQDEWNKVRDLAIKEEEERRKVADKAKKVWQAEMRTKLGGSDSGSGGPKKANNDTPNGAETNGHCRKGSLVATLNKQAEITDEDQKMIEAEILMELHLELSKQAAEKKMVQKPKFLSGKLRHSWSGKQQQGDSDSNKPVEELTEELCQRIYKLNLEMAPNKIPVRKSKSHRNKDENSEKRRKGLFKGSSKSKTKDNKLPPRHIYAENTVGGDEDDHSIESEARDDVEEEVGVTDYQDNHIRSIESEVQPKKRKPLLKALRLLKKKDKSSKEAAPKMRSAEIEVIKAQKLSDPPQAKTSKAVPTALLPNGHGNAVGGGRVLFYSPETPRSTRPESQSSTSSLSSGKDHPLNPKPQAPISQKSLLDAASSSVSTQLTSNKVYLGLGGEAIEIMSMSSRNMPISPGSSKNVSCEFQDRYATSGGNVAVMSGSQSISEATNYKGVTFKKQADDEPTIFEYLEVQYYPHDEMDAPLDEKNADAHHTRR